MINTRKESMMRIGKFKGLHRALNGAFLFANRGAVKKS